MTKKKSTFLIAILAILLAFTFTFTSCESDPNNDSTGTTPPAEEGSGDSGDEETKPGEDEETETPENMKNVLSDVGDAIYTAIMQGDANWTPSTAMSFGQEYVTVADIPLTNCTLVTGSKFTVTLNIPNFEFECSMIVKGDPNTTITMSASGPVSGLTTGDNIETSGSYGSVELSKEDIMAVIFGILGGGGSN